MVKVIFFEQFNSMDNDALQEFDNKSKLGQGQNEVF
jgi:hypothetical protein